MTELTQAQLDQLYTDWSQLGAEQERKRIIKLLESKLCFCLELPDDQTFADREELMKHMNCSWEAMMIEYHVALIKGEQK